jgi:hypothetical protein
MRIAKSFLKGPAIAISIALILLLSSASSWGDTRVMINQDAQGNLEATIINGATYLETEALTYTPSSCQTPPCARVQLVSCSAPYTEWDSAGNGWILIGDDIGSPWSGLITCTNYPPTATTDCTFALSPSSATPPTSCANAPLTALSLISNAAPPTCSYVYSGWGPCQNGTQTQQVVATYPSNCNATVPPPASALTQSCTPPACTGFTYSAWGACQLSGSSYSQGRTVASSSPSGCVGGMPILTQSCSPACTDYNYSAWGTCSSGTQTRTYNGYLPANCAGTPSGSAVLSQSCSAAPACTDYNYSAWGTCSNGTQTRTYNGYSPANCTGTPSGSAVLSQSCATTGGGSDTLMNFGASGALAGQSLAAGQEKVYYFTVPSTNTKGQRMTYFRLDLASVSQSTNLNVIVQQGTDANIDSSYSAVMACPTYVSHGYMGQTCFLTPNSVPVWANITTSQGGQDIYVYQSTSNPPANLGPYAAVLPGTYYALVRNTGSVTNIFGIVVTGN